MDLDARSNELFGRYQALRVYTAIARLGKDEFTTGELCAVCQVPAPQLSRELRRLARLGLLHPLSRRGDYRRDFETVFWELCEQLATEWGG